MISIGQMKDENQNTKVIGWANKTGKKSLTEED